MALRLGFGVVLRTVASGAPRPDSDGVIVIGNTFFHSRTIIAETHNWFVEKMGVYMHIFSLA